MCMLTHNYIETWAYVHVKELATKLENPSLVPRTQRTQRVNGKELISQTVIGSPHSKLWHVHDHTHKIAYHKLRICLNKTNNPTHFLKSHIRSDPLPLLGMFSFLINCSTTKIGKHFHIILMFLKGKTHFSRI